MRPLDSLENPEEEVSGNVSREGTPCKCNPVEEIAAINRFHCNVCYRALLIVLFKQCIIIEVGVPNNVIVFTNFLNNCKFISSKLL